MSLEMKVPALGESITEVTISSWLKKDGDYVEMDEVIAEVETDKATQELPAEASGILRIIAQEDDVLEIGAPICTIDTEAEGSPAPETKATTAPAATAASGVKKTGETKTMVVTEVGESITEVVLGQWFKNDGDWVAMDEIIAEIESDKATFDLPAEASGYLKTIAKEEETLPIGGTLCAIEVTEGEPVGQTESTVASSAERTPVVAANETYATGHASPAAKKVLAEKGIDPKTIKGTGVDGRITKEDALAAQKTVPKKVEAPKETAAVEIPSAGSRNQRREKMTSLRRTVARRLVAVKSETAMLTTFNEVNMKPIMDIRKEFKEEFKEKHEIGLGFMSFFTKAVCIALQEWPAVNAQIDGKEIIYNDFCDISIAVSAPKGLVVPVIRNAESLDFKGIEREVRRLALKARDNKLTIPEMTGGTFTLTNGGVFGSMMSTPIINAPQSAILGMHNIVQRPVVENGEVVVRPIMYLALSYDHRIIDGRESVSFLVRVKQLLENPTRLLIGV